MKVFKINKFSLKIIVLIIYIFCNEESLLKGNNYEEDFDPNLTIKEADISIIVNFQNFTKRKHILFYEIMKNLNSSRNFYFINSQGITLDPHINSLVGNSSVKIIQSNFPDSIFLPLVASLFGKTNPSLVLFIEDEDILDNCGNKLTKWINKSYLKLIKNKYDYIFGNSQIINRNKIGCSLLFSKASIIEHLLYYTDSDTTHIHPFIQLSFAIKTKFHFIHFNYIKTSALPNINNKFSSNIDCPLIKDKEKPSLCIILPNFKRNYLSFSFNAFSNQTYKPKFYLIIQNGYRIKYNISSIQKIVKEPIYHIWMQNWNSFFFLNLRLSSILPCDFILKYDDDQWPADKILQEKLLKTAKNKNIIIGKEGYSINGSYCGYSPNSSMIIENNVVDHSAVPLLTRPSYIKLEARNKIYRLYGGEDIAVSINSYKLCNVTSIKMRMKIIEKQYDGNNQRADKEIISAFKNENKTGFNLFQNIYCYFIRSGYIPRRWAKFRIPEKDFINITIKHKSLY